MSNSIRILTDTESLKLDIIENFIDWYSSDEDDRERIKDAAFNYVSEDHVDEVAEFVRGCLKG